MFWKKRREAAASGGFEFHSKTKKNIPLITYLLITDHLKSGGMRRRAAVLFLNNNDVIEDCSLSY
jgi:hypothetical protein